MEVINHKLAGVEYDPAKTIKQEISPKFIVMHYTAGHTLAAARSVFKTSVIAAHLTVDKDGTILQMVPFNRACNHAGPSAYQGVQFLNNHSIGIEFVNIGFLKLKDGVYVDAYGSRWKGDPVDLVAAPNSRVGSGNFYWPRYPEAQLAAGDRIVKALLKAYPTIRDIVSHEEIDTRGWKTDPGPAFPMARFKSLLGNRPASANIFRVVPQSLNVRIGPGAQFAVAGSPLPAGREVEVIGRSGDWAQITFGDGVAYVAEKYLQRI